MSDQPEEFGTEYPTADAEASGSSNGTGTSREDAVAVADPSAEGSDPSGDEPTAIVDAESAEPNATTEPAGESATSTDAAADGQAATETAADDGNGFLAELVRAMQSTAASERARVTEDTDRRREAHLGLIHARRETEAARIRALADDDMKAIDTWADDEQKRISAERDRRAGALREDLETSLAEHGSKIDREVAGVEAAILAYRAEVDAFFGRLDTETDPVLIAQHAGSRPVFPTLEVATDQALTPAVAAEAETSAPEPASGEDGDAAGAGDAAAGDTTGAELATGEGLAPLTEPAILGVMDPEAGSVPVVPWPAEVDPSQEPTPEDAPVTAPAAEGGESFVPVAAAAGADDGKNGSLLQTTPISRPMSWLRRDRDSGDHPTGDR